MYANTSFVQAIPLVEKLNVDSSICKQEPGYGPYSIIVQMSFKYISNWTTEHYCDFDLYV